MRQDEILCRKAVQSLLESQGIKTKWLPGNEPPDYYLQIGDKQYSVEITSIHGSTNIDGRNSKWLEISNCLIPFGKEICASVERRVCISGCYQIGFGPIQINRKLHDTIVNELIKYFKQNTLNIPILLEQKVYIKRDYFVSVWKLRDDGSALIVGSLPAGGLINNAQYQLEELLEIGIEKKLGTMKKVKNPWILVILDQYGFQISISEWVKCLPEEARRFKAVVRVQSNKAELIMGEF